jgi:hypothetical protein
MGNQCPSKGNRRDNPRTVADNLYIQSLERGDKGYLVIFSIPGRAGWSPSEMITQIMCPPLLAILFLLTPGRFPHFYSLLVLLFARHKPCVQRTIQFLDSLCGVKICGARQFNESFDELAHLFVCIVQILRLRSVTFRSYDYVTIIRQLAVSL